MKKHIQIVLFVGVSFVLGGLVFYWLNSPSTSAQSPTPFIQPRNMPERFSYCALTKISSPILPSESISEIEGIAEIKYFLIYKEQNSARERYIRTEEIKIKIFYGDVLADTNRVDNPQSRRYATVYASDLAFAKALDYLGNRGYEVIGKPFEKLYFQKAFR